MIPKYEKIMLPFLKYIADGKEHSLSETHDELAKLHKGQVSSPFKVVLWHML